MCAELSATDISLGVASPLRDAVSLNRMFRHTSGVLLADFVPPRAPADAVIVGMMAAFMVEGALAALAVQRLLLGQGNRQPRDQIETG